MREISVKFTLTDEDEERLKKITEEYKKRGMTLSEDKQFEGIMCCGSRHDINNKFRYHEFVLGLRKDFH